MGKKSSSTYQEIDPSVGQAMTKQAELAESQQNWYETEMYPWLMSQTQKQNEWAEQDRQFARDQAVWWRDFTQNQTDKLNQRADQQWEQWQATTGAESALADDARNYNQATEQERQTERALTDLTASGAVNRKLLGKQLTGAGIDPTSGQYQSQFRGLSDQEANARAQAILAAEQAAKELGWSKKMQAVGIGQNYLNASANYANSGTQIAQMGSSAALGANGQASQFGQLGTQNISNLIGNGLSNYQSLGNMYNSLGQMGINKSNTIFSGTQAANQAAQTAAGGLGSALGSIGGAVAAYGADQGWFGGKNNASAAT